MSRRGRKKTKDIAPGHSPTCPACRGTTLLYGPGVPLPCSMACLESMQVEAGLNPEALPDARKQYYTAETAGHAWRRFYTRDKPITALEVVLELELLPCTGCGRPWPPDFAGEAGACAVCLSAGEIPAAVLVPSGGNPCTDPNDPDYWPFGPPPETEPE